MQHIQPTDSDSEKQKVEPIVPSWMLQTEVQVWLDRIPLNGRIPVPERTCGIRLGWDCLARRIMESEEYDEILVGDLQTVEELAVAMLRREGAVATKTASAVAAPLPPDTWEDPQRAMETVRRLGEGLIPAFPFVEPLLPVLSELARMGRSLLLLSLPAGEAGEAAVRAFLSGWKPESGARLILQVSAPEDLWTWDRYLASLEPRAFSLLFPVGEAVVEGGQAAAACTLPVALLLSPAAARLQSRGSLPQRRSPREVEEEERRAYRRFGQVARAKRKTLALDARYETADLFEEGLPVNETLDALAREHLPERFWSRDPSLWKGDVSHQHVIRERLGWMVVIESMRGSVADFAAFREDLRAAGMQRAVLLGEGGSSLSADVFRHVFPSAGLDLTVQDSTDPDSLAALERTLDLRRTFFLVASKSGTTTEVLSFYHHFRERAAAVVGADWAGRHFAAITDPGTPLATLAREEGFRRVFENPPDIGGRYSALSAFGLVPAALLGMDVEELLNRAEIMVYRCAASVPIRHNPGIYLGTVMGELARRGRDKVTFLMPGAIAPFGYWLEQLLAESTGKEGTGLVPVEGEPPGSPESYGRDRLFVHFHLVTEGHEALERQVEALREAGHPVIRLFLRDRYDLGKEIFRWEVATAVAGAVLGIDAFDQPNVQESKENTRALLEEYRQQGRLPQEPVAASHAGLRVIIGGESGESGEGAVREILGSFLSRARGGDYLALMAYLDRREETDRILTGLRAAMRDRLRIATTVGYGPRFLHSTGQLHKGGPDSGLFLQITAKPAVDLPIPGQRESFAVLFAAQALGDLRSLRAHGRRVIRIDLERDDAAHLERLAGLLTGVLEEVHR